MRFKIFTILLLVLSSFLAYSQQETIETLDEIIEEIASNTDYELDYTTLFQSLEEYYYNPIDLNSAKESDLKNLMFLTEFQIFSLIKYRQKFGAYVSLYELQFVDGIDDLTLKRILPFVNIQETKTAEVKDLKRLFTYGKHTGIIRYQRLIQEKSGYKEIPDSVLAVNPNKSRYLGSPDKIYYRHNYQYKDKMFYGITAEKDDGEQFFKGAQKYGFDFYSAHFQLNRIGVFQKIILGDYIAQFGQGLTMWSGMSFGKTSSSTNIIKNSRGINKYSSVNESAFLRGQAASIEFGKFNFTEF
ncbi:MAG: helix-hairpin-helix domain-containing protein, partial [Bacteroidales bacterium]|nr:helix-hairpin-helix domain-containing protein [Bacteroidales bacterium]